MSGGCGYADAQDQQMCMGDVVATSSRTSLVFVPPGPPAPFALAKRARVSPVTLPLPPTLDPQGPPRHSTVVPRHSPFEWRPDQGALDEWWMRPLLLFFYADAQDQQTCRSVTSLCVKRRDRVTSYYLIFFSRVTSYIE